jgi:hypothetical protein
MHANIFYPHTQISRRDVFHDGASPPSRHAKGIIHLDHFARDRDYYYVSAAVFEIAIFIG